MASKVDALRKLDQASAAWLLGTSARSLRDWADAPRNGDGTYPADKLVAWARSRIAPPEVDDEQIERLMVAVDAMRPESDLQALVIADELEQLLRTHGDGAAAAFVRLIIERWQADCAEYRGVLAENPDRETTRRHVERRIEAERATFASVARLEEPHVCARCGRLRRGRRWVAQKARPASCIEDLCPGCAGIS